MRYKAAFLLSVVICSLTGCSRAQQVQVAGMSKPDRKILIVYLSRTSNTKAVAEFIHEEVGGTIVALELEKPYPEDYRTTVDQVVRENATGFLPPLKTKIEGMEQYEVVFVGFPTWDMQLPPPMRSFLRQYDLKSKTIIPFNTNARYGVGSSFTTVKELCPASTVLDGFTTRGGIERDGVLLAIKEARAAEVKAEVRGWLKKIRIFQEQGEKR
jgi:flavodoxin